MILMLRHVRIVLHNRNPLPNRTVTIQIERHSVVVIGGHIFCHAPPTLAILHVIWIRYHGPMSVLYLLRCHRLIRRMRIFSVMWSLMPSFDVLSMIFCLKETTTHTHTHTRTNGEK